MANMFNGLVESVKKTFLKVENKEGSIKSDDPHKEANLTRDDIVLGYFDEGNYRYNNFETDIISDVSKQASLIKEYRRIAAYPEVADAIDEITNEMSFVPNNIDCCYLGFKDNILSDNLKEAFQSLFDMSCEILQLNENIDVLCRRFYIDGQLIIGLSYDDNNNILDAVIMNPSGLYFNKSTNKWQYFNNNSNNYGVTDDTSEVYDPEEIIRIDSGLYSDNLILSHLHSVIKIVNQLQTLEDLMIPLRYSRSVSRRVFNIDVGNLGYEKAIAAVEDIKNKFKYKKYYNTETGSISNGASIQSMVEDYYFPNRGGTKGTQVDVLDETGNLGETGDLDYFKNKLYNALKVPTSRLMGENKTVFDFSSTSIESTEIKFFAFINRLRQRFNVLLIEIMKRYAITNNILTEDEFDNYSKYIFIGWEKESNFLERQNLDILKQRLDLYTEFKEYEGDIFSKSYLLKNVLKMTDEEIDQMREEILQEGSQTTPGEDEFGDEITDDEDIIDDEDNFKNDIEDEPEDDSLDNIESKNLKIKDDISDNKKNIIKKATKLGIPKNIINQKIKKATKLSKGE
ncbi:putative portal vertex protein [Campylobacter phage vB_CjeM_Los1]|uniref:Putative portal vertex protein n=1 Tax=Campylobacter phage vB_CjeM_Los1 TaxID=1904491 RepID=A0A1D8EXB8_9CAUD|nr:putative portal vertex protein [Campylobacter phage vB_CjeM_Los1]AOT25845.1 putative portal vertex protein [Campylobacter phage vB_CjeM_Los1]